MLRALLLASPVVLVAVVSCGDSSTSFEDVSGGSGGTSTALGGASTGGKSNQAGNSTKGGTASTAGTAPKGGQGNGSSGSSSNGGNTNAGNTNGGKSNGGNANGGTANQGGSTPRGGSAGAPTDPGGAANAGDAGYAGSTGNDALCPDLFGTYKIKNKEGMCSGLNKDAPQSIEGTTAECGAHFVSDPPSGPRALDGAASIDADGNFTGAMLYLDMTERSPCSGIWDEVDQTITVECGGQGDLCTIVLERQ